MNRILILVFFYTINLVNAQQKDAFPESWAGVWKGKLEIITAKGVVQTVDKELHIRKIENEKAEDTLRRWTWKIVYRINKDSTDERDYVLIEKDRAKGHYIMDEHNDILLDHYYLGGVLWSNFEVQGTRLTTISRMQGKKLMDEIIYGPTEPVQTTGGTSEEIPPVKSFPVKGVQRTVMKKAK
ncbi:MAG: hypothetical protein K1X92_07490 [Bacteroidia bacterium]|nr:hypothetical protein [Bacteroidia bacterium]